MRRPIAVSLLSLALPALSLAQSTIYGEGTPGGGGFVPLHTANGPWVGNSTFRLQVDKALGGSTAFFFVSIAEASIPFVGGQILVDLSPPNPILQVPVLLSPGSGADGSGALLLPLPADAALVGFKFYTQAIISQPGGGLVLTNGLEHQLSFGPEVFVGCSIAGSTDPYQVVDPVTMSIIDSGGDGCSDNVNAARYIDGGRELLVASGFGDLCSGDATAANLQLSPLFTSATTGTYGVEHDARNDLIWTLTDAGSGTRELVALDSNGSVVHATSFAFGGTNLVEIWTLSPTSRYAAVTTLLPTRLIIVDTDPSSATFLAPLTSQSVPSIESIAIVTDLAIRPDDEFVVMTVQNAGGETEVARFHLPTMMFWDHNVSTPQVENIGSQSLPAVPFPSSATSIDFASNGAYAVLSGIGDCGWTGRLDFDWSNLSLFSFTLWQVDNGAPNTWTADLSPDDTLVAVASWAANGCIADSPTPVLLFLDPNSGATVGQVPIPKNTNSSTLQNLYTVQFR